MLIFASAKIKQKGTFLCYFLRRAKSNQKARGTTSCDLGSKPVRWDFR